MKRISSLNPRQMSLLEVFRISIRHLQKQRGISDFAISTTGTWGGVARVVDTELVGEVAPYDRVLGTADICRIVFLTTLETLRDSRCIRSQQIAGVFAVTWPRMSSLKNDWVMDMAFSCMHFPSWSVSEIHRNPA